MTRGHRPRIGITTYYKEAAWGDWQREAAIAPARYVEGVVAAGGLPLLIPPVGLDTSVIDVLDGLVLVGGADVDPQTYGAVAHPQTASEPHRDEAEIALTMAALAAGVPLLAICRGAQVLAVALGGTLHQHLPEVLGHGRYRPAAGVFGHVAVSTVAGSAIRQVLGPSTTVPCYHHQAIDRVPPQLRVTARSDDGLIQAVEPRHPCPPDAATPPWDEHGPAWTLGVQFHPEENTDDRRLFTALVDAAGSTSEPKRRAMAPQSRQEGRPR